MKDIEVFRYKFSVEDFRIYETEHWIWSLRPHHPIIGSSVLSPKRECFSFSELNHSEMNDLNFIIKIVENTLKKAFNYTQINYLALMMIDKQFHFHVFPRFKENVIALDKVWLDKSYPAIPDLIGKQIDNKEAFEIITFLISNLVIEERN